VALLTTGAVGRHRGGELLRTHIAPTGTAITTDEYGDLSGGDNLTQAVEDAVQAPPINKDRMKCMAQDFMDLNTATPHFAGQGLSEYSIRIPVAGGTPEDTLLVLSRHMAMKKIDMYVDLHSQLQADSFDFVLKGREHPQQMASIEVALDLTILHHPSFNMAASLGMRAALQSLSTASKSGKALLLTVLVQYSGRGVRDHAGKWKILPREQSASLDFHEWGTVYATLANQLVLPLVQGLIFTQLSNKLAWAFPAPAKIPITADRIADPVLRERLEFDYRQWLLSMEVDFKGWTALPQGEVIEVAKQELHMHMKMRMRLDAGIPALVDYLSNLEVMNFPESFDMSFDSAESLLTWTKTGDDRGEGSIGETISKMRDNLVHVTLLEVMKVLDVEVDAFNTATVGAYVGIVFDRTVPERKGLNVSIGAPRAPDGEHRCFASEKGLLMLSCSTENPDNVLIDVPTAVLSYDPYSCDGSVPVPSCNADVTGIIRGACVGRHSCLLNVSELLIPEDMPGCLQNQTGELSVVVHHHCYRSRSFPVVRDWFTPLTAAPVHFPHALEPWKPMSTKADGALQQHAVQMEGMFQHSGFFDWAKHPLPTAARVSFVVAEPGDFRILLRYALPQVKIPTEADFAARGVESPDTRARLVERAQADVHKLSKLRAVVTLRRETSITFSLSSRNHTRVAPHPDTGAMITPPAGYISCCCDTTKEQELGHVVCAWLTPTQAPDGGACPQLDLGLGVAQLLDYRQDAALSVFCKAEGEDIEKREARHDILTRSIKLEASDRDTVPWRVAELFAREVIALNQGPYVLEVEVVEPCTELLDRERALFLDSAVLVKTAVSGETSPLAAHIPAAALDFLHDPLGYQPQRTTGYGAFVQFNGPVDVHLNPALIGRFEALRLKQLYRLGAETELDGAVPPKYRRPFTDIFTAGGIKMNATDAVHFAEAQMDFHSAARREPDTRDATRNITYQTVSADVNVHLKIDQQYVMRAFVHGHGEMDYGYIFKQGAVYRDAALTVPYFGLLNCGFLSLFPLGLGEEYVWPTVSLPLENMTFPMVTAAKGKGHCVELMEAEGWMSTYKEMLCAPSEEALKEWIDAMSLQWARFTSNPAKTSEYLYGTSNITNRETFVLPFDTPVRALDETYRTTAKPK